MSLLITGAGGQVGRELVARAGGREHRTLDRSQLDITDADAVRAAVAGAGIVINAAAYTAVDKAETEVEAAFAINREGPRLLALACAEAGIPLLHLSTDYVFDGTQAAAYAEDAPAAPLGVYGQSKWEGEEAIRAALRKHLIIRVAWVFGAYGNNFVKTMLRLAATRPELRVVADQHGGPTHAGAIADVLLALADRHLAGEVLPWGTYHYTGEPATTWHGFAEAIFDEAKALGLIEQPPVVHPITTADYPTPAKRPANSVLDGHQAHEKLQLARHSWIEGLRETLHAWKSST